MFSCETDSALCRLQLHHPCYSDTMSLSLYLSLSVSWNFNLCESCGRLTGSHGCALMFASCIDSCESSTRSFCLVVVHDTWKVRPAIASTDSFFEVGGGGMGEGSSAEAPRAKKRSWTALLQESDDSCSVCSKDDDDVDDDDVHLPLSPRGQTEPLDAALAVGKECRKSGPSEWVEKLRNICGPYFAGRQQRKKAIMMSACSGTGCPAIALEASR